MPAFLIGMLAVLPFSLWLLFYAQERCIKLDVATGRRDSGALADDYGSNRGFYWPWSLLVIVAWIVSAPGMLYGAGLLFALVFYT